MACCGPSKNFEDIDKIFKNLRNNEEQIVLKLNNLKLEFSPNEAKWNSNYIN